MPIIRCANTASGNIKLTTGRYSINEALLDTISLLLSAKDMVNNPQLKLIYDLDEIELTDIEYVLGDKDLGKAFPERRYCAVSPRRVAQMIAGIWVKERYYNDSYAVAATKWLLTAILHEAFHCHTHRCFKTPIEDETFAGMIDREESFVYRYTTEQLLAFVKKYGIEFEATLFMGAITTAELGKLPGGNEVINRQYDWLTKSIVSKDVNGLVTINIREDFRRKYQPNTNWGMVKMGLKEALEEALKDPNVGIETEEEPVVVTQLVPEPVIPPPPPTAVHAPTIITAPAAPHVAPPPPPTTSHVAPPPPAIPLPPVTVYEDDWVTFEAELLSSVKGNTHQPDNKAMIQAIQQSPVYAPAPGYAPATPAHDATLDELVIALGKKISRYVFTQCGWDTKSETGFTNAEAVFKELPVNDIAGYTAIREFETSDASGRPVTAPFLDTTIRGKIFKNAKLPAYQVTLEKDGQKIRRMFVPQNINKKKSDGSYTFSAKEARDKGMMYMWVIDPDVTDAAVDHARATGQRATKFVAKIENGNYITIA